MRVLFFTSGSGSTATYIAKQLNKIKLNGLELSGLVYEPNKNIENRINSLIASYQMPSQNFLKVNLKIMRNFILKFGMI